MENLFHRQNVLFFRPLRVIMSFKSRDQTRGTKRKWSKGSECEDCLAFAKVIIYSISGQKLEELQMALTGLRISSTLRILI